MKNKALQNLDRNLKWKKLRFSVFLNFFCSEPIDLSNKLFQFLLSSHFITDGE